MIPRNGVSSFKTCSEGLRSGGSGDISWWESNQGRTSLWPFGLERKTTTCISIIKDLWKYVCIENTTYSWVFRKRLALSLVLSARSEFYILWKTMTRAIRERTAIKISQTIANEPKQDFKLDLTIIVRSLTPVSDSTPFLRTKRFQDARTPCWMLRICGRSTWLLGFFIGFLLRFFETGKMIERVHLFHFDAVVRRIHDDMSMQFWHNSYIGLLTLYWVCACSVSKQWIDHVEIMER